MANLITRTRRLIGDVSATPVFDDNTVQDKLDLYRTYHRYERLEPQAIIQPGGKRLWTDYYAIANDWEEAASGQPLFNLCDASYNILSPDASDYITGHWTFNAGVNNAVVWITGQSYDLYASAADLAEDWAGLVKLQFDFSDMNVGYKRNQQYQALMDLSAKLRERALPRAVQITRNDIPSNAPDTGFFGNPNEVNQGMKE